MPSCTLNFPSYTTSMDSSAPSGLLPFHGLAPGSRSTKSRGWITQFQVPKDHIYHVHCKSCLDKPIMANRPRIFYSTMDLQYSMKSGIQQKKIRKSYIHATLDHENGNEPEVVHLKGFWENVRNKLNTFYGFYRLFPIIGTILGVISASLLPIESVADLSPTFLVGLLKALIPSTLMIMYVITVNQLYDVEIDKINKPYLPLASGELSMAAGIALTVISASLSIAMAFMFQSPPLLWAMLLKFLFGTAYSVDLPYLRWKQSAFLAILCILSVRAVIMPIAVYMHIQDIPDVEGDKSFGVKSLSIRIGKERVFWLCISLLLTGYCAAMVIGASSSSIYNKLITVLGHGILAWIVWQRSQSIDLESKAEMHSFDMFIWKLYYTESLLAPFVQ
ncbi:probable homogentisate phytyltransferase 1, chloroplastic isoform X3 [Magnolia sinica]|uniref:probable homogentisate phytyltransferase 1, chloroplastic isoform X3 n=1 Tax=Magnolia sinica TaxID=86752 RepID=UPI00265AE4C3|nr:probable homogentisate phytyltransferase 1, chloroplastic isoform X3 [Magnolia sinica]